MSRYFFNWSIYKRRKGCTVSTGDSTPGCLLTFEKGPVESMKLLDETLGDNDLRIQEKNLEKIKLVTKRERRMFLH